MKILSLLAFLCCFMSVKAQAPDCAKFKNGSFEYPDLRGKLSVREGSVQKSFNNGNLEMLWDVRWISECEYELTCKKVYVKGIPARKGDRIYVKIIETDEDCFTSETILYNNDFPSGSKVMSSTMCFKQ